MGTSIAHHALLLANAAAAGYNSVVAAAAPNLWWKLEETSGTTAANSGSDASSAANGTINGGASFSSSGVSIAAPSGYAGLGNGINLSATSVNDVRNTAGVSYIGAGSADFTVVVWVAGSAGSSQYIASRVNNAAIIYQFVSDTVEFFSSGFTGTDPRTGSGISLPAADTTTPHMIVYRKSGTNWSGWKDGSSVFSVTRSFSLPASGVVYLGSDSSTSVCNSRVWDFQCYTRALSDTEIADMYAARNTP